MIAPTGSTPSGGKRSVWEPGDEMSSGVKKVQKSMNNLGHGTKVGVMRKQQGINLSPLEKAWRPQPRN